MLIRQQKCSFIVVQVALIAENERVASLYLLIRDAQRCSRFFNDMAMVIRCTHEFQARSPVRVVRFVSSVTIYRMSSLSSHLDVIPKS